MLNTDLSDHRRSDDGELLAALRGGDPLALAEAYHRSVAAAHACARRLLASAAEVEALLVAVYRDLWEERPEGAALEGWVRARCFDLAAAHLREVGRPPAVPSVCELLADLPQPTVHYLDAAERGLAELDPAARRALLLAHDAGQATGSQEDPEAAAAVERALVTLAGPDEPGRGEPGAEDDPCTDVAGLADWTLGLLEPARANDVAAAIAARPGCAARSRVLRRGRRRLEGLPPTPDMGQRVLVSVLTGASSGPAAPAAAASPQSSAAGGAGVAGAGGAAAAGGPEAGVGAPATGQPDAQPVSALDADAGMEDPTEDLSDVAAHVQASGSPTSGAGQQPLPAGHAGSAQPAAVPGAPEPSSADAADTGAAPPAAGGPGPAPAETGAGEGVFADDATLRDGEGGDEPADLYEDEEEERTVSAGRRVGRFLLGLLLLVLGTGIGLYLGNLFVAATR